jgi:predicted dehydrogenase
MIGSRNRDHTEHVVAALNAGKDVFCEKPVATTIDDHLAIADALRTSGRRFMLGFTLRYSPHYRRIKQLIENDAIGEIVSLEFNETLEFNHGGYIMSGWRRFREQAGPHVLEKCSHDFDVINWLLEDRVTQVASFGGLDVFRPEKRHLADRLEYDHSGNAPYRSWLHHADPDPFTTEKSIVDNQVAILQFAGGPRATFHTNINAGQPERRLYLVGTKGSIRADVLSGTIKLRRVGFGTAEEDHSTGARGIHGEGDPVLCAHLSTAMTTGQTPNTGLSEGLESAVVCLGVDEARANNTVVDMLPMWNRVDARLREALRKSDSERHTRQQGGDSQQHRN